MAIIRMGGSTRRRAARQEFWPTEVPWTGENEKGWFRAPRTLPLLLTLIASKEVSGNTDPTPAYLELLARHVDEGVVQLVADEEHAYSAGYSGERGVRSWRERLKVLEAAGVIKIHRIGTKRMAHVLLVHPTIWVAALRKAGKVSSEWWQAYRYRQLETGELGLPEINELQASLQSE